MGIEETFERIAKALERIASAQEENTKINAWYKNHLATTDALKVGEYRPINGFNAEEGKEVLDRLDQEAMNAAATAAQGVASAPAPEAEKEMTFEELKSALHARGYDFPKGTKRTTLLKAWEAHKDEPVKPAEPSPVEPPPLDVNPVGYAPTLTALEAPVVEEKKPMTREEAMDRIRKNYAATEEDKADFIEALASVGAKMFQEVQDGSFDALVAKYEELKNARA